MDAVKIQGLCKSYPGFKLSNLSLSLPQGCIMGLIGKNGAGKSTTIKLILNMIKKDSGVITLYGKKNTDISKEDIGVVLDEAGIPQCLTALQINKIMELAYKKWDEKAYFNFLEQLSIPADKEFKDFSRGMKMKLAIAIAMSHKPKLLILDEATSGLDPIARDEVIDIFSEFTRDENHAVLISSHIVSDLEKICDYIAFLDKGRLVLCDGKDSLLERYGLIRCSSAQLANIDIKAIKGKRENAYGVEALVERSLIDRTVKVSPVSIEELFIFMVKEG